MEQEKFEIWSMEYLSDALDETEREEFERFLQENHEYQNQFKELSHTWTEIDGMSIPEPSEEMDNEFFNMLHSEIRKSEELKDGGKNWLTHITELLWRPQMAYGILLLCLGLMGGYFLSSEGSIDSIPKTVVNNPDETNEVREQLVLTLLEQPSANKRLQGINELNKIAKVDETVIKALLKTLNGDANVNVRLAAIESLTNYLDEPMVREGLVQSIVKQDSPIIQVTLANLMVALQEKESIEPFKTLMRTKELDEAVKDKLETTINSII